MERSRKGRVWGGGIGMKGERKGKKVKRERGEGERGRESIVVER